MSTSSFDFTGGSGAALSGRFERPIGPARAYALFAHCFTCSKDTLATRRIARALSELGVGVLRFDFTGLGDSGGEFGQGPGFSGDVADLVAAANAMAEAGMPPSLLIGHSLGGAAALAAAEQLPTVKAVATIAAPYDPAHVTGLLGPALPALEAGGEATIELGGRPIRLKSGFLEGLLNTDPAGRIGRLHRALLILHAPRDTVVGIENAEAIFRAARHPKSFISLDAADHLLTRAEDADYAAAVIAAWASRYVDPISGPAVEASASLTATATPSGQGLFQTFVDVGGERLLVDEPVEAGGQGLGPSPYGLISGALAACTAMTLRLYGERKGWGPAKVKVEVVHAKAPGQTPPDVFTRRISLLDNPDEERRAALMGAAERCPVHKSLRDGVTILTEDADRPVPMPPPEDPGQHVEAMKKACDEG